MSRQEEVVVTHALSHILFLWIVVRSVNTVEHYHTKSTYSHLQYILLFAAELTSKAEWLLIKISASRKFMSKDI